MPLHSFLPVDILVLGIIYKPFFEPGSDLNLADLRKIFLKAKERLIKCKFWVVFLFTVLISIRVSLREKI